jgi:PHS family inorganic phosphate transporter-like MFS transporter
MVAAVFSMQGLGQLAAAIVALITTVAFKNAFVGVANESECGFECRLAADRAWRIIVGVGAIPACAALYYRITIPETPRYTFDVELDVEKADADIKAYVASKSKGSFDVVHQVRSKRPSTRGLNVPRASWSDLIAFFRQWTNLKMLLGTTLSWFFLDLAFYGLGLNNTFILHAVGYGAGNNLFEKLQNQAVGMIILTCAGSLPGYWMAILTVDTFGRKPLQVVGFLLLTILFCVLGFTYNNLTQGGLLALYIIGQFLFNAGPNTTTFIVPGECFPTRYRSTGHGISAAMGKIGAIVAQVISIPMVRQGAPENCKDAECTPNMHRLLQLFALFMLFGTFASLLIPETKGMTLEELSGEPRTSYNSGCNGSISLGSPKLRAWNPFHGGQPAGFSYPRSRVGQFRKSDRVGIMTSPELMAETSRLRKTRLWRRHRKAKSSSGTDIALSTRSSGTADDDIFPAGPPGATTTSPPPPPPPSWGAGWGRIDRGGPPPLLNSVQLQDVGSLLTK